MWIFWTGISWGDIETNLGAWIQEIWQRHPAIHAQQIHIEEKIAAQQSVERWKEPSVSLSLAPLGLGYSAVIQQPYLYPQEYRLRHEQTAVQIEESKRSLSASKESLQKDF